MILAGSGGGGEIVKIVVCDTEVVIGISLLRVLLYTGERGRWLRYMHCSQFFSPFLYERSNLNWVEGLFGLCELKSYFVEYRSG